MLEFAQSDRGPADLSREFEPTMQTIINWLAQAIHDESEPLLGKEGLCRVEREELSRQSREVRPLNMERDILVKVMSSFARKCDGRSSNSSIS